MKQKIPTLNFMVAGHADAGKTEIVKSLVHSLAIQRVLTPLKHAFTPNADPNASNATLNAESECAWSNCFDVRINSTDRAFVSFIDFPGVEITHSKGVTDITMGDMYLSAVSQVITGLYWNALQEELQVHRNKRVKDSRIHCLLYVLNADICLRAGGLSSVDVQILRGLSSITNVVVCIGKMDHLSKVDQRRLKDALNADLVSFAIPTFTSVFSQIIAEEADMELEGQVEPQSVPSIFFLSSGENLPLHVAALERDEPVIPLIREFPWGKMELMNPEHCDFSRLRKFVLEDASFELRERTAMVHYENWRSHALIKEHQRQSILAESTPLLGNPEAMSRLKTEVLEFDVII